MTKKTMTKKMEQIARAVLAREMPFTPCEECKDGWVEDERGAVRCRCWTIHQVLIARRLAQAAASRTGKEAR